MVASQAVKAACKRSLTIDELAQAMPCKLSADAG